MFLGMLESGRSWRGGIGELDRIIETRSLMEEKTLQREEHSRQLERCLYLEEVSWR
jgi:hypothetical protein